MNIENIYENSKKNSIGKDKKQKLVKKIKKISTAALPGDTEKRAALQWLLPMCPVRQDSYLQRIRN